ncbi:MAG: asparaginase [Clostridia bacterium]|nr:asparaginase [Clostridia bacterium]
MKRILLILTGGTICSVANDEGKRDIDTENAKYKIVSEFKASDSPFTSVVFDTRMPINTLSESMTVEKWSLLLDELKKVNSDDYEGIIILHGTDTLAYTASLLSLVMSEKGLPVCLVSSHSPIDDKNTNANINFRAGVELIMNGIKPNVYAVYQNSDGKTYVHYSAHLLQCANYSNDFYSRDAMAIESSHNARLVGKDFEYSNGLLSKIDKLVPGVLFINPVVGMDYNCYNLDGVSAVVHTTYHSETVCVEGGNSSFAEFAERCKKEGVSVILTPCDKKAYSYVSTAAALKNDVIPVSGMTNEMAYVKAVVGCSLGLCGDALAEFITN